MKTAKFIFLAAAAVLAASCAKEVSNNQNGKTQINAYLADSDAKTTLVDGGSKIYWEPGDEISVFYKDANIEFASLNSKQSVTAVFASTQTIIFAQNEDATKDNLLGLYPYDENAEADGLTITTTHPSVQTAKAGSFASGANIAFAKSANLELAFYNLCGGIRFTLVNEGIKSIAFEAVGGEKITGKFTASLAGEYPTVSSAAEGSSKITLNAPTGTTFETGKWYYITALPTTLASGFKMTFYKTGKEGELTSSKSVTIARRVFGSIENIDKDVEFHTDGTKPGWIITGDGSVANLIDDNIATAWVSSTVPATATIDFGKTLQLNSLVYNQAWDATGTSGAASLKVEFSTDNSSWTSVADFTPATTPYKQTVSLGTTYSARYARITIASVITAGNAARLAEIDFNGPDYTSGTNGVDYPALVNAVNPHTFTYVGNDPLHWNRFGMMDGWTHENTNGISCDSGEMTGKTTGTALIFVLQTSGSDHGAFNVDNAKVFQTLYFLPGIYSFAVWCAGYSNAISGSTYDYMDAYFVASKGSTLTDYSVLDQYKPYYYVGDPNCLNAVQLTAPTSSYWQGVYFQVNEPGYVSVGWVYKTWMPEGNWMQYPFHVFSLQGGSIN